MDHLKLVVSKLNTEPFCRNLRLIDLDGQPAEERIEILNDVFRKLGFDVGEGALPKERKEDRIQRTLEYLAYLKNEDPAGVSSSNYMLDTVLEGFESLAAYSSREQWLDALGEGKKDVVFDILYWILSDFDRFSKRAYLSKYLAPFGLPLEVTTMQHGVAGDTWKNLIGLEAEYQELQETFKKVHTEYERLKVQNTNIVDYRSKTRLLEREREQLAAKVQQLHRSSMERKGFKELLQVSSLLRKEKEKASELNDIINDQKRFLHEVEQELQDKQRQLQDLQNGITNTHNGLSVGSVFDIIENDIESKTRYLYTYWMPNREQLEQKLNELEEEKIGPLPTTDDIGYWKNLAANLEGEIREKKREIENLEGQNKCHLDVYRQQTKLYLEKVSLKENELKTKQEEKKNFHIICQQLKLKLREEVLVASSIDWEGANGYQNSDLLALQQQKDIDQRQASRCNFLALQKEVIILKKTEETLRKRLHQFEFHLNDLEVRAGVHGYRDIQTTLEQTSVQTAQLDEAKDQTLKELSNIIQKIVNELEEKKNNIKPMMKRLQDVRRQFQDVKANFNKSKERYDKYKLGYTSDLKDLKIQCDFLSNELIVLDRRYHYLAALLDVTMINLERVQLEDRCKSKKERFLPEFPTIGDLYQNKLLQQENLAKQLRYQEKELRKNENEFIRQKILFSDLQNFLECKLCSVKLKRTSSIQSPQYLENEVFDVGTAQVLLC